MIDSEPHSAEASRSGQAPTTTEDTWVERVVAFVSSMPWWLRWVWVVFLVAGAIALLPPDEPIHTNNVTETALLLLSGGESGGRILDDGFLSKNLRNMVQQRRIVDLVYQEEFTYSQLLQVSECEQAMLFKDGQVAAADLCGIVFVTTGNTLIDHIMSRSQFEAHREEVLSEARGALRAGGSRRTDYQGRQPTDGTRQ